MDPLDLLAVVAHPDDAELSCGGSLLKSAEAGQRTGILDLTRGEMGSRGTPEIRAQEAERAREILQLAVRKNAGLPDSALENTPETRSHVAGLIRELRPRIIITHWINGRHPDHRAAAELVYDAAFLAGLKNFDAPGEPFRPLKVIHALSFREDAEKPTFVVDISAQMNRKLEAIAAYESQFGDAVQAGEVFPGGSRSLEDQIRAQGARTGSLIRAAYGEPFWTRETLSVPTLTELTVSTY
jgi:bacillithiol biosynthesis deacetylase BshB1